MNKKSNNNLYLFRLSKNLNISYYDQQDIYDNLLIRSDVTFETIRLVINYTYYESMYKDIYTNSVSLIYVIFNIEDAYKRFIEYWGNID